MRRSPSTWPVTQQTLLLFALAKTQSRDVESRISAAWAKWREVAGVICDPKMPVRLKGQVYKTIIRPVLLYGSEAWPVLERHKQSLRVTEMNMLRWMSGVSRKDRIKNSRIRGSLQVRDIADKLQEGRLR
ncbi:hypothetical protein PYW08_013157 [Mythimna loreyi]|uniref:Uncharacterized protein n=1 Tax=Mythimna loreyi TaxID=667449 RepID=A0ACC2QGT5_9NEOP|nr:hypothetical protein PYW08_013157 [Mythimna loreyi]